jgi:hypothetical protein
MGAAQRTIRASLSARCGKLPIGVSATRNVNALLAGLAITVDLIVQRTAARAKISDLL